MLTGAADVDRSGRLGRAGDASVGRGEAVGHVAMDIVAAVRGAVRGVGREAGPGPNPSPARILEVGAGRRLDVAFALADAFPDTEVVASDRTAPVLPDDAPGNVRAAALDLEDAAGAGDAPDAVTVVVAVRLPPELWPAAEALADRHQAPLVVHPLPEEALPPSYDQVRPGVYVRRPRGSGRA